MQSTPVNKYQTPITDELLLRYPKEVRDEFTIYK